MKKPLLIAALALAICATASASTPGDATPVIAAERAFAADAAREGWTAAFRVYAAADATQLSPGPVNAQENLRTIEGNGSTNLAWGPAWAGMSRDGQLGFTTGPYWSRARDGVIGQYFTVWRKQADGSWKWIFDGGTDGGASVRTSETDAVPAMGVGARVSPRRDALDAVQSRELAIIHDGANAAEALGRALASDAHVNRAGAVPAIGAEAGRTLIAQSHALDFGRQLVLEASDTGDLAFTLGEARWEENGAERHGYYARIWRNGLDGWHVVFDEIVPVPPTGGG